jgi:flotillin
LQESLKASSGIDVKEMLENYTGKGNIRPSIDQLTNEVKAANTKQPIQQRIAEKQAAADEIE